MEFVLSWHTTGQIANSLISPLNISVKREAKSQMCNENFIFICLLIIMLQNKHYGIHIVGCLFVLYIFQCLFSRLKPGGGTQFFLVGMCRAGFQK